MAVVFWVLLTLPFFDLITAFLSAPFLEMGVFFADCINFALERGACVGERAFLVKDFFTELRLLEVEVVFETVAVEVVLPVLLDLRMTCFSELEPVGLALFFLVSFFDMTKPKQT